MRGRPATHGNFIEHAGERLTVSQWARKLGISRQRIFNRLALGWDPVRAVATPIKKIESRRTNITLECNGECLSIREWAKRSGINYHALLGRLNLGWSPERAITTPLRRYLSRAKRRTAQ